jgi:hypothetical protein
VQILCLISIVLCVFYFQTYHRKEFEEEKTKAFDIMPQNCVWYTIQYLHNTVPNSL